MTRIVALEEHFATADVLAAWKSDPASRSDLGVKMSASEEVQHRLMNLGDDRVRAMDAAGVDVQVLSLTTPGIQLLPADRAIKLARAANDAAAAAVRARPDRFQAFATLPVQAPDEACRELERAVKELGLHGAMLNGGTVERTLDHRDFLPIFETAAQFRAPIYIHPSSPPPAVQKAYYAGFDDQLDLLFSTAGIGWHYEAGIHALRLVLSGAFDRLPDLQLILGHWGEVVLFYLERIDAMTPQAKQATSLKRPISDYFRSNVSVTPSALFSQRYLRWAREVLGPERIMMSVDHPFVPVGERAATAFLDDAKLEGAERDMIASGNWDRLCAALAR